MRPDRLDKLACDLWRRREITRRLRQSYADEPGSWEYYGGLQHGYELVLQHVSAYRDAITATEPDASTLSKADARLLAVARMDRPYSILDCLRELAEATEHLLHDHCCDVHGHEGRGIALRVAREILYEVDTPVVATKARAIIGALGGLG